MKIKESLSDAYNNQYNDDIVEWRDVGAFYKANNIINLCNKNSVRPGKILEVGAGEGGILYHLHNAGFCKDMHALEISEKGVDYIKKRNIKSVSSVGIFDGYNIPFSDNSFDLVVLSHVLEHVEYERAILREIKRVSTHQVIEVPLDYSSKVDQNYSHFLSYGHINIYTAPLVRFLLKSEGFDIIDDMSNVTGEKVLEYMNFNINNNPRTTSSLKEFHLDYQERIKKFEVMPKDIKEKNANEYTVLCRSTEQELEIF